MLCPTMRSLLLEWSVEQIGLPSPLCLMILICFPVKIEPWSRCRTARCGWSFSTEVIVPTVAGAWSAVAYYSRRWVECPLSVGSVGGCWIMAWVEEFGALLIPRFHGPLATAQVCRKGHFSPPYVVRSAPDLVRVAWSSMRCVTT